MHPDLLGFVLAAAVTTLVIAAFCIVVNVTTSAVAALSYRFASLLSAGLREWWRRESPLSPAAKVESFEPRDGSTPDATFERASEPVPTSPIRAVRVRPGRAEVDGFTAAAACRPRAPSTRSR